MKHHLYMVASFLLATAVTACGAGGGTSSVPDASASLRSTMTRVQLKPVARLSSLAPNAYYEAIDAGGPATGAWIADTDFNGGALGSSRNEVDLSRTVNPAPQAIYQTQRYAAVLVYKIPNLTPGATYNIRLHFAETFFASAGKRVFNITVNGQNVEKNFDIYKKTGGANIAIAMSYPAAADTAGAITVIMAASVNFASVAGIEIVGTDSSQPPTLAPGMSIDAGGSTTGKWSADTGFSGGWVSTVANAINTNMLQNAAPQAVYQTQRVGTAFNYTIANLTPSGNYTVRLHFVESFFTSPMQRIFNVTLNGQSVLTNFDIFEAAGGTNVATIKQFTSTADATGRISIQFVATVNNASVAGLEVVDESASPTPTPSMLPSPTTGPTASSIYYNYSGAFTGNTPFHHKVGTLLNGYAVRDSNSSAEVANWINNPYGHMTNNHPYQGGTFYVSKLTDQVQTWNGLNQYGSGDDLIGQWSHVPIYAVSQATTDHHLIIDDAFGSGGGGEYGGIECAGNGYGTGPLGCGWGAFYNYSGSGLSADSSNGYSTFTRGGYASGLGVITAYDLQSAAQGTPIAHALMLTTNCTTDNSSNNTPQIYPSFGAGSDARCPDTELTYGALVHLTSTPAQIAASGASQYCQYILTAIATYGMYVTDNTGNPYGSSIEMQSPSVYDQAGQSNYLVNTVEPSLLAGGDASGSVDSYPNSTNNFGWSTCLNRVWSASNWEVLHITTTTSGLPAKSNI